MAVEDSYCADVAREIADLKLAPGNDDRECFHNYHSPNPCIESIRLFEQFAARHGFELSVDAAYMFQAFVRGEMTVGGATIMTCSTVLRRWWPC